MKAWKVSYGKPGEDPYCTDLVWANTAPIARLVAYWFSPWYEMDRDGLLSMLDVVRAPEYDGHQSIGVALASRAAYLLSHCDGNKRLMDAGLPPFWELAE